MLTFHHSSIDSTNLEARRLWEAGASGGRLLVVTAEKQTGGIGRDGRPWKSPPGGLWLTMAWPFQVPLHRMQAVPLVAGLAVVCALEASLGICPRIKWPNDVLSGGCKLAGILCQTVSSLKPPAVFLGIGMNGNYAAQSLGGELRQPATTLMEEAGGPVDLEHVRAAVVGYLEEFLERYERDGLEPMLPAISRRLAWRGESVRSDSAAGPVAGILEGIDAEGRLLLRVDEKVSPYYATELQQMALASSLLPLNQGTRTLKEQGMEHVHNFPKMTAEEAAELIPNGATIGFSGFTPAGAAKALPRALAARARQMHADGKEMRVRVLTGASTGDALDEALAQAEAISWRAPYASSKTLRKQMNSGKVDFVDMHLSHVPQAVAEGFFGKVDFAVVEAVEVTSDGRVYLSSSIGASPTYLRYADKVIVEINKYHSPRVAEMSDIFILPPPPHRSPIPIQHPLSRIGTPYAAVDPKKIVAIIETDEPDGVGAFTPPDETSQKIAANVVKFLVDEMRIGRIPKEFLPLQSGVGNVANAVMAGLSDASEVPPFYMYTEVFQDSLPGLMKSGKLLGASTTSLTLSPPLLKDLYDNMDFFGPRIVMRPQELSNNPGVVRRLGVITTNTALEVDIYGHANSTHVAGMNMMNGVGGSGDFTRNAYLSIFMAPSVAKGGKISTIVPMASHVDHNEHSVHVVVTDQGVADLRGLAPMERASALIEKCAHPVYRPYLHQYIEQSPQGHIRHDLGRCFEMHRNFLATGAMLPDLDLAGVE